jgi:hypothetical protein
VWNIAILSLPKTDINAIEVSVRRCGGHRKVAKPLKAANQARLI